MSFLETLQRSIESHLNKQEVFLNVPVISHQESNFEACLKELVHSGMGSCIVVLNPIPLRIIPQKDSISFEDIYVRVQVIESACSNTAELSCLDLAEKVSQYLHHFSPPINGWKGWLALSEWKEIKGKEGRYILEISFQVCGSSKLAELF